MTHTSRPTPRLAIQGDRPKAAPFGFPYPHPTLAEVYAGQYRDRTQALRLFASTLACSFGRRERDAGQSPLPGVAQPFGREG